MKRRRRRRRGREGARGFALLIIVLLVALLALMAATLLDLVAVDITIAGEHSKTVRAQMVADGAIREVIADSTTRERLPTNTSPGYRYRWAGEVSPGSGSYFKDPANLYGRTALDESNSAYAKWTGTGQIQENYSATVDHLRVVPMMDSGNMVTRAVLYEVNTDAMVAGGDANHELAAEMYTTVRVQKGHILPLHHRR